MSLLLLPTEVLSSILDYVLYATSVREAVVLRPTCRRLDKLVQDSVFRFPTASLASVRMGKDMTAKLIHAKLLLGNADERPLCYTINRTVDFLSSRACFEKDVRDKYIEALVKAAVESMFYWDIIKSLVITKFQPDEALKENALVAATGACQLEVVTKLLNEGAKSTAKTRYFGEPLSTAALSGFEDLIALLLNSRDWNESDHFTYARYVHAVEAAARGGHQQLTIALLGSDPTVEQAKLYGDAITQAIKSKQETIAIALLDRRPLRLQYKEERNFWLRVTQTAVEYNCRAVLQHFIGKAISTVGEQSFSLAVELACRQGHIEVFQLLLSNLSIRDPQFFTTTLFWAGNLGNVKILDSLLTFLQKDTRAITQALAGAISGDRPEIITRLLKTAGVVTDGIVPMRFTDAIHLLMPALPPKIKYRSEKPRDRSGVNPNQTEEVDMQDAIANGNLFEAISKFCSYGAEYPTDDMAVFSRSFDKAAITNQPDILLYLCENRYPFLMSACAVSTAILQIFCDFGWDVNEPDYGKFCTRLDTFTQQEHLLRWLLDHGADSCAKGGKDITPTSRAITSASLRTVKLLLERGQGVENGQLLHFAVQRDNPDSLELVELLLNLGCPIDGLMFEDISESWTYWRASGLGTALYAAAERGKISIASYLLERGADPSIPSSTGQTALEVAEMKGYTEVARLLRGE